MPIISITCGVVLIFIGAIGYVDGVYTGRASLTALIPALFGIVMVILGAIARSSERLRKHLMHAAVLVALLGFIIPGYRVISRISEFSFSAATVSQISMALVCLIFVIVAIRSFISARR
jgi:hypothetical protein